MTASTTKPGIAARKIAAFERQFGRAHLYLAYHAALPIALTPDLLYRLRLNVQQDSHGQPLNIPWIAVSDLLLSSLCHEVGYELYQMDTAVRDELLERLRQDDRLGQPRIQLLSNFLLDYVHQNLQAGDPDVQTLANAQRWVALAYTHPHKTAYEIASFIAKLDLNNKAELLRLEVMLQTLAVPLEKFQSLFNYGRGLAAFARGNFAEASNLLRPLLGSDRQIRIVGVKLPIPEPIQGLLDEASAYPNYRHAVLRGKSFKAQNLSNADFSFADLRGANFTYANLTGAKFSQATMGLRSRWMVILIMCAILLSIAAGIGAMLLGYFLQTLLINPPSKEIFSLVLVSLVLSVTVGLVILRWGIEATLGALAFAMVGMLYLGVAISGVTESAEFTTTWDWLMRVVLAIAGIVAFTIGLSSSRLGVLNFAVRWAPWWIGSVAFGLVAYASSGVEYLLGRYTPYVVTGVGDSALRTWFENALNRDIEGSIYIITATTVVGVVGIILCEAISIALVQSINKRLALFVGLAWIPIWLGRLSLSGSSFRSSGALITVLAIVGLGMYVGWRSLTEDSHYSFINQAAVAVTSEYLRGTSFRKADLTDANFSRATIAYVNFSDANLTRVSWFQANALNLAHFTETYLRLKPIQALVTIGQGQGQVLDGLSLPGINLSGANLTAASLANTDLKGANLQDADLSRSNLSQTQLDEADLTGACLTGAIIQGWKITNSTRLDGVECDYIYTRRPTADNPDPGRLPEDYQRVFEPGDFADFIQQVEQPELL
jgi:uncharacterized protein YjbI with pentapeptide repeats